MKDKKKPALIDEILYAIEIVTTRGERWAKVGEGCSSRRPDGLVASYMQNSRCRARKAFEAILPRSGTKRLNDKYVHSELEKLGWRRVDDRLLEAETHERDGKSEVFDLACRPIEELIADINGILSGAKQSDYRAKVDHRTEVSYDDPSKFHQVSFGKLFLKSIRPRIRHFGGAAALLIGQFEDCLIAHLLAAYNKIVILHDSAENMNLNVESWGKVEYVSNLEEVIDMRIDFDLVISNPPYGPVGTAITQKIIDCLDFGEFVNLLPANDYFKNCLYEHIADDPTIVENGFEDVNQTTTACRLSKSAASRMTLTEARMKLSIVEKPGDDPRLHIAFGEAFIGAEKAGMLSFSGRGDFHRYKAIAYDDGIFLFNAGAFDVINGNLAVYDSRSKDWTLATKYNLLRQGVPDSAHSDMPGAKVSGCAQFKRLIYSELGLKTMRLWFSHSPEGWGLGANGSGMFADVDYSGCVSWEDYYRKIGVSEESIGVLISEANKIELTGKEIEAAHLLD